MIHVFIIGGQRIDQNSKKDGREARGNEEGRREDREREQREDREKRKRQKDNLKRMRA